MTDYVDGSLFDPLKEIGFELVVQEGGGTGGAEYCYSIFEWQVIFYKYEYSYFSYQGYEFDVEDAVEVTPKQKLLQCMSSISLDYRG